MDLTPTEQALLDTAAVDVLRCEAQMRVLNEEAEKLKATMDTAHGHLRGTVNTVLTLRGLDPNDYRATWSAEEERMIVTVTESTFERVP